MLAIIGVCANGAVALIALIVVLVLAWNYLKLLLEAAERYVLLGVLVYTAPVAFSMGASQSTSNIFKSWCRMFGGQVFLLLPRPKFLNSCHTQFKRMMPIASATKTLYMVSAAGK